MWVLNETLARWFMVALKFHSFVFVGRHWNMDKEFWKFIEFEGSGRPRAGDGMIEAFRLLSSARAQMLSELRVVTKKQTAQCCLAQAECGGGQVIRDRATLCSGPRPGIREPAAAG